MVFASGQAAAAAVFQALDPGDCALVPRNMYWALRKWLLEFAAPRGLTIAFYDNASIDDLAAKSRVHRPRLIWIETPANPTWELTDIAAACYLAREIGAIVAVDSTSATPLLTRPIELGAHIVMHSATKYLNGHSDVIAGAFSPRRRTTTCGNASVTFAAAVARFSGRSKRGSCCAGCARCICASPPHATNALAIAQRLQRPSEVVARALSGPCRRIRATPSRRRQMRGGFGGMMSLRLRDGEDAAKGFTAKLRVFKRATSLGSVESLAEHRASVEGPGTLCPADLVRLSIGIEHATT